MTLTQNTILFISLMIAVGCDTSTNLNMQIEKKVDSSQTSSLTETIIEPPKYIWTYNYETEIPIKINEVNPDTLTAQKLVDFINLYRGLGKITLDLVKVSKDTIYVAIKESSYLTQGVGTTGADDYVSTTVYTLTELKGVKYVNFNFTEGDHAQPGTYSRQYYIDRNKSNTTHR